MLDEGTATRSAPQIADQLAQVGASLGTRSTMDATFVEGASLKKNFAQTLDLMADVALHPSFPADEVERQRASRLAQLVQQRQSAGQLAAKVMAAVLYGDRHPYGFTELGTEDAVKAFTRDDLVAFWKQNFVPNNAALVVSGDIVMSELKPLAEKAFSAWTPGTPARPVLGAPQTTSARLVIVDKPGAPQTELRVVGIGAARSSPDFQAMRVMNTSLGELFSSRINMNLREEHGYTYGASSQFVFRRGAGPFVAGTGVRTDVTAPAVSEILKEVRGMSERPIDSEELRLAKDSLTRSLPGAFETSANAAGSFSNVYIYDLGLQYFTNYATRVDAVSTAQAKAVAEKYLVPGKLVVVAVGDRAKIEPELRKLNLGPVEIRDAGRQDRRAVVRAGRAGGTGWSGRLESTYPPALPDSYQHLPALPASPALPAPAQLPFEQRFERVERAFPAEADHFVVAPPPLAVVTAGLSHTQPCRGAAVLTDRRAGHFHRHRPDRIAIRRQPEAVGDEEPLSRLEQHHRSAKHAAEPAENLVAEIGGPPFNRVRSERARRRDRSDDLPPRAQRGRIEERLEDDVGRRLDQHRDVQLRLGGRVAFLHGRPNDNR